MKKLFLLSGTLMLSASVFAQSSVTTGGMKYSVLEDVTGAWCQYCPDGTVYQNQVMAAQPRAIGVALHNADKMSFADGNVVMASPNLVCGYPGGLVDRKNWNGQYNNSTTCLAVTSVNRGYWSQLVSQQVAETPKWDVSMTHSYNPTTRTVTVNVTAKSLVAQTGKFNINAWIIEDSVVGPNITGYNQVNAYNGTSGHPYQGAGSPIIGFVHRHVERAYLGGAWGSTGVITANPGANATFSKSYTYVIDTLYDKTTAGAPKTKLKNIAIVGMVMKDETVKYDREIMNAVEAKLVPFPTSVENVNNINDLTVFPNPAQNIITIKGMLDKPADVRVAIMNALGQVVSENSYNYKGNLFGENISVAHLTNGVYFVNISTEDGAKATQRLVIAK